MTLFCRVSQYNSVLQTFAASHPLGTEPLKQRRSTVKRIWSHRTYGLDIFMILCTNENMIRRSAEKKDQNSTCIFTEFFPLKIWILKSCPLNKSQTLLDIFMKLCTNIKHDQTVCKEQGPLIYLHFTELCPFKNFD